MPCRDPDVNINSSVERLEKVNNLTNMLCIVCGILTDAGEQDRLPVAILHWWNSHRAADAARRKQEAEAAALKETKRKALAKLTKKEKAALGLGG